MSAKPKSIEGDLLGLALVEAHLNKDLERTEALLNQLRTREDLLGALRSLTGAFTAVLETNLTRRGGLIQIKMFREAMLKDFYGEQQPD